VQLAAIVGPLTYGAVLYLTDNNYRLGMMITGGFFIAGLLLIASINIERGRRAAVEAGT
jgi:UMF1 family MFS transporter